MNDDKEHSPEEFENQTIEQLLPGEHQRQTFFRLMEHLRSDTAALVALKGHLVIEEKLTIVLEKFVFHPEHLEDARLSFAHRLAICRSLSLDQNRNSIWNLVGRLNTLRNALAHSLDSGRRRKAMTSVRELYYAKCEGKLETGDLSDEQVLTGVSALCLGFLDAFEREIERFREFVNVLDKEVNPHRYPKNATE
jgi:hypothetical protein